MASTSAPRNKAGYGRIASAATTMYSDNQGLISEMTKVMRMIKETAVDLERENKSEMVKELEDGILELGNTLDEFTHLSNAIRSIGNEFQPADELTNFNKLFDDKIKSFKDAASSVPQDHQWLRKFREAVWNVHHEGQPMPGEEQEDIVMTSTQCNLLNVTCPLTGKPITELVEPVRSMDCKHIYEKRGIMLHIIKNAAAQCHCPVAGCPKILTTERVVCDPLLLIEIDEMRSAYTQRARADMVEDFTRQDEDD